DQSVCRAGVEVLQNVADLVDETNRRAQRWELGLGESAADELADGCAARVVVGGEGYDACQTKAVGLEQVGMRRRGRVGQALLEAPQGHRVGDQFAVVGADQQGPLRLMAAIAKAQWGRTQRRLNDDRL